jgi:hypothetical protein
MSARTDALVSQQETGKITASIVLRCGRLPPSMSCRFNADSEIMFRVEADFLGVADGRSAIGRQVPAGKITLTTNAGSVGRLFPPLLPNAPKTLSKMPRNIRWRVQF